MSVNLNRSKTKWVVDRKTYRIKTILDLDPYDERYIYCRKDGTYPAQRRMNRTWKHNRKTQYKQYR